MKKLILAIAICALMCPGGSMAAEIPAFPFVFVYGQAEKEVAPDLATVSFSIEVFDEDPARALSQMEGRSAEVMSAFRKYGIEGKDIVAYEIRKEAVRERKDYVALRILGYEVSRPVSATLRRLDKFDEMMTKLVGLKNVTRVRVVFDTTKRKEVETELFRQAAQKAREKADFLAGGFGTQVASVHAISVSQSGFASLGDEFGLGAAQYRFDANAPAALRKEGSMNLFVPGTIKLRAAVSAIFRLK